VCIPPAPLSVTGFVSILHPAGRIPSAFHHHLQPENVARVIEEQAAPAAS